MARPLLVEYLCAFYHVINRCNVGGAIFRSKADRIRFLEFLEKRLSGLLSESTSSGVLQIYLHRDLIGKISIALDEYFVGICGVRITMWYEKRPIL